MDDDDRRRIGEQVRREVLGDAHVDRTQATSLPESREFQDFITRVAWGDVWARPGLDRRTRSCLTIALLATLGHWDEFALHVRAGIRNGLTRDEIAEVLLHTSVYAGVPVANHALTLAWRALDDESPAPASAGSP
ncbi:MAG TPA: carboxymuconolactone decarboxylase family protein [Mycobacteriales bacterium]|jgi:4-carboxymuconolactone decarboxylase/3-oxoadipate enol-lactonase/4-carboxymuconolactone decarboxylase|nr:carboxymuconolactone decarboxylase family protein [Mycobacteriales bacterium]